MTKLRELQIALGCLFLLGKGSTAMADELEPSVLPVQEEAEKVRGPKVISRQELHRWQRHIRGFRREHHFSMSTGVSSGTWEIKHFGDLENRKFTGSGIVAKFRYSFHLPIYQGFGYFLGSSLGYHYESSDSRSPFKPVPALMFPGIMAGLAYNISPVLRVSSALEVYLERHERLGERDGQGDDPSISVTMQTYDVGVFCDIFYDLAWALRLEAHARVVDFYPPDSSLGHPVDARIHKSDAWLGVGLVYHLL